ncbi:MAG TPA: 4Fe-4S binding protein [Candidatus Omnitrophica bacterium]|nr:4Fe-4S binding protein [Candidatus Omnitrophota bacterium]
MFQTGKISRYRSILFVLIAFFFFLGFKLFRYMELEVIQAPYCHIAQSSTLFNFIHSQFLGIVSGNYRVWGVLTLGFLWLLLILTIGQGICSWVCFYGGIDTAFSCLRRTALIKLNVSKKWRDFPIAFLVFILIISFMQGSAVYCKWFCPLKLTTGFWDSDFLARNAQIAFFFLALLVFLVLLPIFTKKRTFCSFLCPFGALVSLCGKLSPYRVVIDKEKCSLCKKCVDVCPVCAIDKDDLLKNHKISSYCNRCGQCMDSCPTGAIDMRLNGRAIVIDRWGIGVRHIFIFLSLLITGVISNIFVPDVLLKLIKLIFS